MKIIEKLVLVTILAILVTPFVVFASEGLPVLEKIAGYLSLENAVVVALALVAETALRVWNNAKAHSVIRYAAMVMKQVAKLLEAMAKIGDKVVPDKQAKPIIK